MGRNSTAELQVDWDPEEVKARVRMTGTTLADISRKLKLHPESCRQALRKAWPRCERAIARCIGVDPWVIWPSRYTADRRPKSAAFRYVPAKNRKAA